MLSARTLLSPVNSPVSSPIKAPQVDHAKVRRRDVAVAALFCTPPFEPEKLSIQYCDRLSSAEEQLPRRYTLTHNDITGALRLTVGRDYNYKQISGFYTQLVRDDVLAEWRYTPQPSLHIFCHVSGKERWLAPPSLRNYIFRRELSLVLESFLWAEQEHLLQHPYLAKAEVYVHFDSCQPELHKVERWGIFGDRQTWQLVPPNYWQRLWEGLPGAGQVLDQLLLSGSTLQPPGVDQSLNQQCQAAAQEAVLVPIEAAMANDDSQEIMVGALHLAASKQTPQLSRQRHERTSHDSSPSDSGGGMPPRPLPVMRTSWDSTHNTHAPLSVPVSATARQTTTAFPSSTWPSRQSSAHGRSRW